MVNDPHGSSLVGRRLGIYQVVALLGAGGMGEVYRARDTRLGRDVALKVLPAAFTADPDCLARLEREARMLAALNHRNIATIHGFETLDGTHALVLEMVEGETLADRIHRPDRRRRAAGLPLEETLPIARQIADALDAAHEKGIVHRDLKPANIKITSDGVVKVLDFGLAKLAPGVDLADAVATSAPTITGAGTREGLIVGTAAYMSPEQARGQPIDKRTDIWAFGCVLYEMLTGRVAFARETITDTLAAILEREPDWSALPTPTPVVVRRLLERCLNKDLKRRLRDIGDTTLEIETASADTRQNLSPTQPGSPRRQVAAGVLLFALGATLTYLVTGTSSRAQRVDQFVPVATDSAPEHSPSWSHDGQALAYVSEVDGVAQIFTKSLSAPVAQQVTKCAINCENPFWAPDGNRIYYNSRAQLWSVGAAGGEPQLVAEDGDAATSNSEAIAFLRGPGGNRSLWIMAAPGSAPERYRTPPFPDTFTRSWSVEFSKDGSKIAVLIELERDDGFVNELWILPYPSGAPRRVATRDEISSLDTLRRISWEPDNRHIVIANLMPGQGSHLFRVDTEQGTVDAITTGTGGERTPSVSRDGSRIAFTSGGSDFDLVEVSLDGSDVRSLLRSDRNESAPAWSPSGNRFLYVTNMRGAAEIWSRGLQEQWSTPVLALGVEGLPAWYNLERPVVSADGQRVAYGVNTGRRHAIWISPVAGGRPVAVDAESYDQHGAAWSPDGNWIAYQRLHAQKWALVKAPLSGGTPVWLADTRAGGGDTAWSRSGEWLAYVGRNGFELVSADGATHRVLGKWLPVAFAFSGDSRLVHAVRRRVQAGTWELSTVDLQTGTERVTAVNLPPAATVTGFSLHPDGRRFVTSAGISKYDIWVLERPVRTTNFLERIW